MYWLTFAAADILQHQIIQISCFNLMAGTGVLTQPVVGLADIVCPVSYTHLDVYKRQGAIWIT